MTLSVGSNLDNTGLVFYLDARNPKSWQGEPTTNLANTSGGAIDWSTGNLTATVTRSTINATEYKYRITNTGSSGSFRMYFNPANLVNGETYTVSYKYRIVSGQDIFYATDWNDQSITRTTTLIGNYYYETATGTRATYDSTYRFLYFFIGTNAVVDIWEVQLEQRTTATAFTSYQRTNWFDLSGNGYDLSWPATAPTYSTANQAIEFRSTSDMYGNATFNEGVLKQSNELGEWSIEVLFKQISASGNDEAIVAGRSGCHGGIYIYNGPDEIRHAVKTTEASCWTGAINTSVQAMTNGSWYHTIMSYENGYIKHYVNGVNVSNSTFDRNTYNMANYDDTFRVGGVSGRMPNIDLSIVRCYNIALNDTQALQNYTALQDRMI